MVFYIRNIRQVQAFTKHLGQYFLSLKTLPGCQRRLNSTKPSFIQWDSSLKLNGRTYALSTSNFHHSTVHRRTGTPLKTKPSFIVWNSALELSGRTFVPTTNFHHSALRSLRSGAHLKTKPLFSQCNSSLKLSGRTYPYVPSKNFHHLAEHTMNSNAAYLRNMGAFILKPTETNITTLKNMGIKVHYVYSLNVKEKMKKPKFEKNVSSKVTETEETP